MSMECSIQPYQKAAEKTVKLIFFLIGLTLLTACGSGSGSDEVEVVPPEPKIPPAITGFSFLAEDNPSLETDVYLQINDGKVSGRLPAKVDLSELIANVDFSGESLSISGQRQANGVSVNDFTQPIEYVVETEDAEQRSYVVDVVRFTGLPIVFIETLGSVNITSKEDYVEGLVRITGNRHFDEFELSEMKIRGRGNSTWFTHPKKPYQMKLEDKASVLSMPAKKKWLLLAEYSDKSLLRNTLAFELGYLSNLDWTPKSEFVEVFVNDQYNGTYNLSEKVEEGSNRVDISEQGFLLEVDQLDRQAEDDVYFYTDQFLVAIKEPELSRGDSQYQYIQSYINEFEDVLFSSGFNDPVTGYAKYIDVESFVDWFLISEIAKNVDSKWYSSIYFHVAPGDKIKMGPLWDFDLGFGNVDYADAQFETGFWVKDNPWITRLLADPNFKQAVQTRFSFFRQHQTDLLTKIDNYAEQLKWAQQENDEKWQTLGVYVWPNPVVYETHAEEVAHLKRWFTRRMNWLETAIGSM